MSSKKIKVHVYNDELDKKETRKIVVKKGKVLEDLRKVLPCLSKIEYFDEDGDIITATSELELTMAVFEEGLGAMKAICDKKNIELLSRNPIVSEKNEDQHTSKNGEELNLKDQHTSEIVDECDVEEAISSTQSALVSLTPPPAKKKFEFVDISGDDVEVSTNSEIQSSVEKEAHVKKFGFPVELKVKILSKDSLKIECGICCRWISINNFQSKKLCHLKDHFNTPLHLSNTELQKSRVECCSADLPKLQVNREIILQCYSKVFHLADNKAQCRYCLKDGVVDLLPKTGSFKERVEAHLASKYHQNLLSKSCGNVQAGLSFKKESPSGSD